MNNEQRIRSDPNRRAMYRVCSTANSQKTAPQEREYPCCCGACSDSEASAGNHSVPDAIEEATLALPGLRREVRALFSPRGIALTSFGLISALFLWQDERARAFTFLPYVVLLTFPLLHLFLLRGETREQGLGHEPEQRSH